MSDGIDLRERYDLVVVGAGPAGMAAASSSAGLGLSTIILDEQPSPGGQIYRAVTESPLRGDRRASALGASYWRGSDLARGLTASGATHVANATVWSVSRDADDGVREIAVSLNGRSRMLRAPAVILATGAQERPVPIPGWTLPGVMTAGAAQILLKTSALVPAGRAVLAGSGPLLWLLAAQLSRIGAAPATILDTTPPARASLWRDALAFAASPYIGEGLALMREVRAHIRPIRATALAVEGDAKVEAVRYRDASGVERRVEADTVLLHLGVVPNTNLARSIGCAHAWNDDNACFDAEVEPWGATSRPGIWIAGDGAGIAGAVAAAERGRLATLDVAHRLGRIDAAARDRQAVAPRAALERAVRGRRFLDRYFRPAPAFRAPDGDVTVCRCEEVRARDIIEAVAIGGTGPNQLKAYLRCGMGPCQGRMCGLTVTELIGRTRGVPTAEVGYYRLRAPVKPITVAELAAMPRSHAEMEAVDRG